MFAVFTLGAAQQQLVVTRAATLCSDGSCGGTTTIGAEISGVTNFETLTEENIATIRGALVSHKVIFFKAAAHLLNPESQLAFAERFGSVYPDISRVPEYIEHGVHQSTHSVRHDKRTGKHHANDGGRNTMLEANKKENKLWEGKEMPGRVARLVREPGDPFAFGEGYHADVTFFREPPFFTFLVARELPGDLDDTFFIDTVRAYDTLPAATRREVEGLGAVHNDSAGKWSVHPFVRTHPENGQRVLYVNSHFTHTVEGYAPTDSRALLDRVYDHIESQPIFKFKWTCDVEALSTTAPECMHVIMWDNRQLQHTATTPWAEHPVYGKRRRELHRVTISGDERPFFVPAGLRAAAKQEL